MSVLEKLASAKGRRDEVPNQELARTLASRKDRAAIKELAANLMNPNPAIQADCIKVLYEIGYLDPALISAYAEDFLGLLHSRNNRMVWGGMIALGTIASLQPDFVFHHRLEIQQAIESGSVITIDNGILALSRASARNPKYATELFPFLLTHLKSCRAKDLPQRSEKILVAVDASNCSDFAALITRRMKEQSGGGLARLKKVLKQAEQR